MRGVSAGGMSVAAACGMTERMESAQQVELARAAVPLDGTSWPYERFLDAVGDARFVLLGEATHGTHEFYRERARITKYLIENKGFDAVAVEADWPDAHRVHRFIQRRGSDKTPDDALASFKRFPTWMWRNRDVRDFVGWLRLNAPEVAFYGLDLYSLHASIEVVLAYLEKVDPDGAKRAKDRYSCFEHFGLDTDTYAHAAGLGLAPSCEVEVTQQLIEMRERARELVQRSGDEGDELYFEAEMNVRLVKAAEEYYRSMLRGSVITWNLRDGHMADTLEAVSHHLERRLGRPAKIVVWEHNSHLGDARATEMGEAGELNVGQLVRERHGRDAFLVGFTTYEGTVTAAADWGGKHLTIAVRPAMQGSHELLLHSFVQSIGVENVILLPGKSGRLPDVLREERLERAIGVVYRPLTERASHWFHAKMADQFDALIHIDRTSAVEPLVKREPRESEDLPETYPSAL
ncbi:MAG TPA: erythromycin esterase family protein [Labilithrix sp.]|nr:erythromycin esterase family protein [Labilithrix sp.]